MDIITSYKTTRCNRHTLSISTTVRMSVMAYSYNILANQHFTVIVLLEYIHLFARCMNIMLGKDYFVNIILNALPSSRLN